MELIVISHPDAIQDEANVINALLDEGLKLFHLRKPTISENEMITLLKKINVNYYSRIAIHQHHSSASLFGINRIHFSEKERLRTSEEELKIRKKEQYILSTSIHSISDYGTLSDCFSYTFLGPVFESISKPGYKPKSKGLAVKKDKTRAIKIIAIGGITVNKIQQAELLNFDGVAMLGAIWNDTQRATKILRICQQNVNMY